MLPGLVKINRFVNTLPNLAAFAKPTIALHASIKAIQIKINLSIIEVIRVEISPLQFILAQFGNL